MIKTKRSSINWVICAAGVGQRFKDIGISKPKPQINLKGLSFLERSIMCLDILPGDRLIILTLQAQKTIIFKDKIQSIFPWVKLEWIELKKITKGQLDTFYCARNYLDLNSSVVIWNADTYFKSNQLPALMSQKSVDAIVPCGKLAGDHWSFFKTNNDNKVIAVQEKKRVSDWASVGFYFFRDTKLLIKIAKKFLSKDPPHQLKEHYVSEIYDEYINNQLNVVICDVDLFLPFGTPEDVKKYWKVTPVKLKKSNL